MLNPEEQQLHSAFLDDVERFLRPLGESVRVADLGKRIPKPAALHRHFRSFSGALRADPSGRFSFSGTNNTLSVHLVARPVSTQHGSVSPLQQGIGILPQILSEQPEHVRTVCSSSFVCPITQEVMRDPAIAADGFTYERAAIERWFQSCKRSPSTNSVLMNTNVVANRILRQVIEDSVEICDETVGVQISPAESQGPGRGHVRSDLFPPTGEQGLWVYEVVDTVAIPFTAAEDIKSTDMDSRSSTSMTGWAFRQSQFVSSTFRRSNRAKINVVQVEHGLGWVCADHLREVTLSIDITVFQVVPDVNIGKRAIPDHRKAFKLEGDMHRVSANQKISTSQWITGSDGTVYLRVDGGWVPDQKQGDDGGWKRMMKSVDIMRSPVVYQVTSQVGLMPRVWPCHVSGKVTPITTVRNRTMVGSRTWVRDNKGNVYILVEHGGVTGWLCALKDSKEIKMVTSRPVIHNQSPGSCVQVQLGPQPGAWILLVDEPGARQVQTWVGITSALANQCNNCEAKGRRVCSFSMCPDGDGWVCFGERPDGTGGHLWTGGLCRGLADSMLDDEVDEYTLGTNDDGSASGVAFNSTTGAWRGYNMDQALVADLKKKRLKRIRLLHNGQFWAKVDGSTLWRLHNKHLEQEVQRLQTQNVLEVAECPETGAWVVIAADTFSCSKNLPRDLEKDLSNLYRRRKANAERQHKDAEQYDAVLARLG